MVGDKLADRYQLTEKLSGGQFLSTYLAVDLVLGIEVEVDVLAAGMSECIVPAQRLQEILDASMLIRGPHTSPLHTWGEETENGFIFMVRERAGGASLAEVLAGTGELPLEQVIEITRAMVEVLAEAYGRGLFYLGLNPNQIMLDGRSGVKSIRVGFGWILEEMEPAFAARVSPYRSPETDGGKEGSRTSDVYALAVMVREMLPHGEGSDRLHALLEMAMDPIPKRRPSSPRLLLEELEGSGCNVVRGPSPGEDGEAWRRLHGGGGTGIPGRDAAAEEHLSLARKPRRHILRRLLLVLGCGLVLWLLYAAVAGLLCDDKDAGDKQVPAVEVEKVTLPDLQGLTVREAEDVLTGLGLEYTSREAPSRLWSAGRVAAQEPAEGSVLQPGDTVCLVISTGREESADDAAGEQGVPVPPLSPPGGQTPAPEPPAELPLSFPQAPSSPAPAPAANAAPRAVPVLSCHRGPAPLYVAMDGSRSHDPDGGIVRYVWYCGDGTVLEGVSVQHVFDPAVIPASYRVVLEVFDAGGISHSSSITLEVY